MDESAEFSFGGDGEKRSLVGTAMARSRATTRTEKNFLESGMFEPLLENILAFAKAFQKLYKASNPPPSKPGKKRVTIAEDQMQELREKHADALDLLSRCYLGIVIEFSNHRNLLADQKFFKWLHGILCQFIDNSLDKSDAAVMAAVQLELHRIFQGDRFNQEAKKPEQRSRLFGRVKIKRWQQKRISPALSKEMAKHSPIVGHLFPSQTERLEVFMQELDSKSQRTKLTRPATAFGGESRVSMSPLSSVSTLSRPARASTATIRKQTDKRQQLSLSPTEPRSESRSASRAIRRPQSHGGWEARQHSLSLMEKRKNWKGNTNQKLYEWQ